MNREIPCSEWLAGNGFCGEGPDAGTCDELALPPDPAVYQRMPLPSWIVIHHSATGTGNARLFRCLHRAVRGWADIGYHFVIGNGTHSCDGEVEEGRPADVRGAHAKGSNHCSIGICLVGDFESGSPTCRQLESLGGLLADLTGRFGIPREGIMLHRDVPGCSTLCPGRSLTLEMALAAMGRASA